jgi:predicted DNA-binding transcriptional regulator AlpA
MDSSHGFKRCKVNASHNVADAIRDGRQRAMMSVDDVAIEIGCCSRSVRRWADSGRMPRPIKLGSLVRWPRAVIEQWIADGCPNVRNASKGGRQ